MTNEEIIKGIKANLTGDDEKDFKYLREKIDEYGDNEEVKLELGHMLVDVMPKDTRLEIMLDMFSDCMRESMEKKCSPEELLGSLSVIMKEIEDLVGEGNVYVHEPFEQAICNWVLGIEEVKDAHVADAYKKFSAVLMMNEMPEECAGLLSRARKVCPADASVTVAYAEILLSNGCFNEAFEILRNVVAICFSSADLTDCYIGLGNVFLRKNLSREALAAYSLCHRYKHSEVKKKILDTLEMVAMSDLPDGSSALTEEEVEAFVEKYNIPTQPDERIIAMARKFANHFIDEDPVPDAARYFLSIVYDLTGDEDIKKQLDSLK